MTTVTEAVTPPARPSKGRGRRASSSRTSLRTAVGRHWYAWAMVTPVVVVLAILVLYPMVQAIWLSLTNTTEANQAEQICQLSLGGGQVCTPNPNHAHFVGLDNYVKLLTGQIGRFWSQFGITLIWTFACVIFHYTIGLGLAMLLNRPLRGRSVYRIVLILPWAVPAFVSAFAWKFIFDRDAGLINKLLGSTNDWFDSTPKALTAVIIVNVWLGVPFMMVAILGGLQSIPAELYEAASIDGATAWQRFTNVTLPGLRSVSATIILLGTIWTFNMFPIIYIVSRGGPAGGTEILVTGAFKEAFEGIRNYSIAATYGVLILSVLIAYSVGYRYFLRKQGEVW
ncbi:carbohydrate ABC transporter permease [Labedaea rhizosphaerae]|uniref:Carbohydrate ABC transporter membrane protein 1 (CUT1 family) n=1 Tax=Labedaea rhizosphaerae TaxID=598644 RepID=A0A4R6SIJ9_LABRH|nr:sugar ABC transporter permease [Labedaea rhizosphaerae]TDQ00808.1 carbohydrate ABC transporter membrane protein 1 (CUT1 family) [Labedaea rhizosphaerae]